MVFRLSKTNSASYEESTISLFIGLAIYVVMLCVKHVLHQIIGITIDCTSSWQFTFGR